MYDREAEPATRCDWRLVSDHLGRRLSGSAVIEPSLPVDIVLAGELRVWTWSRVSLVSVAASENAAASLGRAARSSVRPSQVQSAWVGRAQLRLDLDGGEIGWRCVPRGGDAIFTAMVPDGTGDRARPALGGAAAGVDTLTGIDLPHVLQRDRVRRHHVRRFLGGLSHGDREALVLCGVLGPFFWFSAVSGASLALPLALGHLRRSRVPARLRRPWSALIAGCFGRPGWIGFEGPKI